MAHIDSLYDVLDNLLNLNRALYTLAVQKKEVLIKGDMDDLVQMTQQEQKLIKAITITEASRIQIINGIFADKGLPLVEQSLLGLIKGLTNVDQKSRLSNYREDLIRIVSELRDANELNQQLLEQSLSFVNHTLDLLTDSPEDDFIYRKPVGNHGSYQPNRSFINKKA